MDARKILKPIKLKAIPLIAFLVIGSFLFLISAKNSDTFQITKNSYNQEFPVIYKDYVVWMDDRNGNWDIYGYNISTEKEFPICTDPHDQRCPAIYENIIVWEDERNDSWDIYGYNLFSQEEFLITKDKWNQRNPAIYEDIVVWADDRNPTLPTERENNDIYGYNLTTGQEFEITTNPYHQENPVIYGDIVVWVDERHFPGAIYGLTLSTQKEFQITGENTVAGYPYPVIYADTVVWGGMLPRSMIIYGYNISESKKFPIFKGPGWPMKGMRLAMYDDVVLWVCFKGDNRDIHGLILSTHKEFIVASGEAEQYWPALYGDIAVWVGEKDGELNIYGRNLSSGVDYIFFSYRRTFILLCCSFIVIAVVPAGFFYVMSYVRETISKKKLPTKRDFSRDNKKVITYAIIAAFCFFFSLGIVINAFYGFIYGSLVSDVIYGFLLAILSSSFVYIAIWLKKTPFIRITKEKIIIRALRYKKVMKWDNIQKIDFKDEKVDLNTADKKVIIFLDHVHKNDKEDLIQALKNYSEK